MKRGFMAGPPRSRLAAGGPGNRPRAAHGRRRSGPRACRRAHPQPADADDVDAFAAYERLVIGARTSGGVALKSGAGKRYGELPYGYRLSADGRLEEDQEERQLLAFMNNCRIGRGLTWQRMAVSLNQDGYRT